MVKIDLGGCSSFVKEADYKEYVDKALEAFDVLEAETGAGNDFLGWKTLPVDIPESLIAEFEAVRDDWTAKGVNLAVVIGIGGSYLGARAVIEALGGRGSDGMEVIYAGHTLDEAYYRRLLRSLEDEDFCVVVISKSGTTTEPAIAFRMLRSELERRYGRERARQIGRAHV